MRDIWKKYARSKVAIAALAVLVLMGLTALAAPWVAPYHPVDDADPQAYLAAPGPRHWMGTDRFGRDVLSRLIYGTRISFQVGAVAVSISLVAGTLIGVCSGYFGRATDATLSRAMDIVMAFPDILLALAIMAILGASLINVMIAIGIVYTPIFARIARSATLQVRDLPYIEAARALGTRHPRILLRHVLPNISAPLIVQTTLSFAFAILAEAALSFLGLGVQPDAPSWGIMLRDGKSRMELAWWVAVFPGVAITLTVLAFNLLGDGLRDALDPRLKQ